MLELTTKSSRYEESRIGHQPGRGPSGWVIPQMLKRIFLSNDQGSGRESKSGMFI